MRAPEFWQNDGFAAKALSPLGALYGLSTRLKEGTSHPYRPRARVLCIGNLTAGGTGKTPVAIALARMLLARAKNVVFLSRGYGGSCQNPTYVDLARHRASNVGDEALLLAGVAPTIVARDRAAGAKLADTLSAGIIVMDDGFQNFSVTKDVSLVVVDAQTGFGNGRLIPAGPLREKPEHGLARASAMVVMGDGALPLPPFAGPILRARMIPTAPETLRGKKIFAFAGIGRPEKFFAILRGAGAIVTATQAFADHHMYSPVELAALRGIAARSGSIPVTTEKDFARIVPGERREIVSVPAHVVIDHLAELNGLLDKLTHPPDDRPR